MLSFEQKREVLRSFPELKEVRISFDRFNYELTIDTPTRRVVAREFSRTGNGYVYGSEDSTYPVDSRGWIHVKSFTEPELRKVVREAINFLKLSSLHYGIDSFLKKHGLLPLDTPLWNRFEIHHTSAEARDADEVRAFMDDQVGNANGIYIYTAMDGEALYIGTGMPIRDRLWKHFMESFGTVPEDLKNTRWHQFFSAYRGPVTVYWTELEDESMRELAHQMLTMSLGPKFLTVE